MNYFKTVAEWFKAQTKAQILSFLIVLLLIVSLSAALILWLVSAEYGILFNELDIADANHMISQLEEAHISYQVKNKGRDILIDKRLIDKTRIKLMGGDLALSHSVGFELFDKSDFGMTEFSQKINYQRALQGELERTINSLEEVKQSRVHLVIPENHLFQQGANLPRAAISLTLNRSLTTYQIKSIQQLITASVANLTRENVIMVDQNGNSLTANDNDTLANHFAEKKLLEQYLNEKVLQMLYPIFTHEEIMVKIDVTLNYDELQRDLEKPEHDGLIHEKESQHKSLNKSDKNTNNQDITKEKTYRFGQKKEHFTRANGTIERLTVSVVLPEKTDKTKIAQVERLVKSVVGFNSHRGDVISVEALILERNLAEPQETIAEKTSSSFQRAGWAKEAFATCPPLLVLLFIGLLIRHRRRLKLRQNLLNELHQWLLKHD